MTPVILSGKLMTNVMILMTANILFIISNIVYSGC